MSDPRRRDDLWSYACLAFAFVFFAAAVFAQSPPSQDTFNALTDERIKYLTERIGRLESGALWLAGALILNLGAHVFQIHGEIRRRKERG